MKEHFNFDKLIKEDASYELARPNEIRLLNYLEENSLDVDWEDLCIALIKYLSNDNIANFVKHYFGEDIDSDEFDSNENFNEDEEFEDEIDELDDIAPEN